MKKVLNLLLLSSLVLLTFSCSYTPRPPKQDVPDNVVEDGNNVFNDGNAGKLIFSTDPYNNQDTTFFTNKGEQDGSVTKNIKSISSTISMTNGIESAPYGIIFLKNHSDTGKDYKFFCAVLITCEGEYLIGKMVNGKWHTIRSREVSDAIKMGLGKENTITINYPEVRSELAEINSDSEFELYINNTLVTTFKVFALGDNPSFKEAKEEMKSDVGYIATVYQKNTVDDHTSITFSKIKTTLRESVSGN